MCRTQAELDDALRAVSALDHRILVEELLEGEEVSLFAICDGGNALPVVPAQDFKRAFDGDEGPNTGGMGSYAPAAGLTHADVDDLVGLVHRPVLGELERRGSPFVGLLYAGIMLTSDGPRVLEFNCRFGDPETQSVLPLLDGDLLATLAAASAGELGGVTMEAVGFASAVTVVLAAGEYPAKSDRGTEITGVEEAESAGALVFHGGTALHGDRLVTNGGRILGVTGVGETLAAARDRAYAAIDRIAFAGMRYRSDIARAAADGLALSPFGQSDD